MKPKKKQIKITIPEDVPLVTMEEMADVAKAMFGKAPMPKPEPFTDEEMAKIKVEIEDEKE